MKHITKNMRILAGLALLTLVNSLSAHDQDWTELFDGKTTDGWTKRGGEATYKVEDGTIVGTTGLGPNTFLCTEQEFGDFELEFEVKYVSEKKFNSGCQIRSKAQKQDKKGKTIDRVNGPQVEIETGPGQAGYIYGEQMSGWLSTNPKSKDKSVNSHQHFKNEEWNHYRIVAKGSRIQTWINGAQVEDLTHDQAYESHPKGFIGLQVHSTKNHGRSIAWRKIRIRETE
ncbi:MAG: DUF1080 domain-containing protein [Verrucomicrobiota bacterium]